MTGEGGWQTRRRADGRATIYVEFDDTEVRAALDRLKAAGADLTPGMKDIGDHLVNTTKQRFFDEEAPDGTLWAPLTEATKKRNVGKILTLDALLHGQITRRAGPDSVEVGSPAIYAGTHQFGAEAGAFGVNAKGSPLLWGDIPARPFLGVTPEDETEITALILDYLSDAIDG